MGVRLLELLHGMEGVEVHLVVTPAAAKTLALENPERDLQSVRSLVHEVHDNKNIGATVASGSYPMDSMVVIPASMHTVAAMAHGLADNLLLRAADVFLKERRNVIVVPRETPLHLGHLRNLTALSEIGACILPPMVAFYQRPKTIEDVVDQVAGRVLEQLKLSHDLYRPWDGGRGEAT